MAEQSTTTQEIQNQATATSATASVQTAQPASPAQQSASHQATGDEQNPSWLKPRLEQARGAERNALLKQFGVENPEQLSAKLQELEQLKKSQMSESERAAQELIDARNQAAKLQPFQDEFTRLITVAFDRLPEETRQQIDAEANGDALERSKFMRVMGLIGAGPAKAQQTQAQPATTTPPGTPKPPAANGSTPQTPWEKYQALLTNPATRLQAGIFYRSNAIAIEASKPA
jgi:hypothetical protein